MPARDLPARPNLDQYKKQAKDLLKRWMYNGGCTPLGLVATSIHPRVAGVLQPLIDVLLARGARLDALGGGNRGGILNSCLANGRPEAAEYLATRGAPLDLEGAAGVGRLDLVKSYFKSDGTLKSPAIAVQVKDGFTWACEYGRTDVVEFLLEHGVDASEVLQRPHKQTGLHWAAYGGHLGTVKALLKRRPKLDVRDASLRDRCAAGRRRSTCRGSLASD